MEHILEIEYKKGLSIKTDCFLNDVIILSGNVYGEESKCVEISEKILGRPFKEGTIIRVAVYFDPLLSHDFSRNRELFSHNLPVK